METNGPLRFISALTLDDLMRDTIAHVRKYGSSITASRGRTTEVTSILLELTNPRARISRTESRGKPFSCLGELYWYLSASNEASFITYYIPDYNRDAEDGYLHGGYGPRLFDWKGQNQVENVIELLQKNPTSRRAVIQLFDSSDLSSDHKDIPCTCTVQLFARGANLDMHTHMRSNDLYLGLPHDVFSFTMLQEIIARQLNLEPGRYCHSVGSLHIYERDEEQIAEFINEGWQPTKCAMPPMPSGNPCPQMAHLLEAEKAIRLNSADSLEPNDSIEEYWLDLVRLLKVFRCYKDKDFEKAKAIAATLSSPIYEFYVRTKLAQGMSE